MRGTNAIELIEVVSEVGGTRVLDGLDLHVPAGRITALLGPSGAGKTVTVKHIVGLMRPSSGAVRVLGRDLADLSEEELRRVRSTMAVMLEGATPQGCALFGSLSAFDNVAYAVSARERDDVAAVSRRYLDLVGLTEHADKLPDEMSAGMRKRLALARALALEAPIVVLDDFEGRVEAAVLDRFCELVRNVQRHSHATVVLVTHDMSVARRLSNYAVIIAEGRTVASGTTEAMFSSQDPLVSQFLRGRTSGPIGMGRGSARSATAPRPRAGSPWVVAVLVVLVFLPLLWAAGAMDANVQF